MAKFSRIDVVLEMKKTGMVPVFYHQDINVCKSILKACYEGGARVFEFTNRGDFAHEVFAELVKYARKETPEMKMGVGSIIDAPTSSLYIQSGADFIVSPILNQEMAKACNRRKIAWMPGCGSLTEISQAEEWGAEVVKIFPAKQVGGPDFIKAVKGPCPWSHIMPTGGVTPEKEDIKQWIASGALCVGLGSQLFTKMENGDFNLKDTQQKTQNVIEWISELR
ncbi:bifunctional 4-hydroxy-2-oxoglutarate aldolase/2-dehydro-3-deoxy-phosphogluconate aldolase [Aureibacter tunicatorum]|uniref:2-dehydro-3-deoxyphosphogluconate aldolase/(4S)-4-hydroxy-2-oxoglutarate aldolase n=1 Tax=Aureibacter tunicatorum TaxID=866807 RepID=A0AAE3XML2_9BACT|nr:bifunctional 4-hydroxy-2-oxoglutarate aldolase/2-dehydro-3-deoxy-phosphogluconate aldolase [Aureibacter tunicatorum]MDR6239270.1 2-dehydro-3-deoxyphosphogluconate aldolase/(4S)-4-hydroxy-2-oxoglutarate aldolase [Aureibacter tunicatorum]BDD04805.1 bifunctional 4-hydroxy-2-oxoglutarate aldolase/2-dehydro-3-deoxy-phosphogluconate aldolase [Aureibacter tunicatorum]